MFKHPEKLVSYVQAILNAPDRQIITASETQRSGWLDQGFEVTQELTVYHFCNGVVIQRSIEQDNFPDDAACAECWISYEVLVDANLNISPPKQSFSNRCRESFWVKYHA